MRAFLFVAGTQAGSAEELRTKEEPRGLPMRRLALLALLAEATPKPASVEIPEPVAVEVTPMELSLIHISEPTRPY